MNHDTQHGAVKTLLGLGFAWVLLVGVVLLQTTTLPRTHLEWFLAIVLGPPFYAVAEHFFGWVFSEEHGRRLSVRQFSVLRVALAVLVVLGVIGLGIAISGFRRTIGG